MTRFRWVNMRNLSRRCRANYTAAACLYALAERVNSNQQRKQREHPAGDGEEITVLHTITFFRECESRCHRASLLALHYTGYEITAGGGVQASAAFALKVSLQSFGLGLKAEGLSSLGRKCNRHHAGLI